MLLGGFTWVPWFHSLQVDHDIAKNGTENDDLSALSIWTQQKEQERWYEIYMKHIEAVATLYSATEEKEQEMKFFSSCQNL